MSPKAKAFLAALAVALPFDQITKEAVIRSISYGDRIPVIEGFFSLTHVRNPGAAFSLFADSPEPFRRWFFLGAGLLAVALIFSFYRQLHREDRLSALALGCVLGGATGNLLDRIRHGEVIDFLHFRLWSGYSWPDFNIADSMIVVGVGLLILELFATEGEAQADPRGSNPEQA